MKKEMKILGLFAMIISLCLTLLVTSINLLISLIVRMSGIVWFFLGFGKLRLLPKNIHKKRTLWQKDLLKL